MSKKTNSAAHVAATEIVRWLTALVVSAALLLGAVSLYNTATERPEGTVYTGSAQGMFCQIEAKITVSEGKIVDVTLTGAEETPALGGKVLEEMPAKIVEAQSADVDGVAGATITSNAVKDAVKEAMIQAGLLPAAPAGEEFTGTAQGMFCEIEAKVIVADGKIVAVSLTGDAETPELGGKVLEEMPAKIVEAQSADVDGMAGATITTNAVKDAVKEAMTAAGLLEAAEPAVDDVAERTAEMPPVVDGDNVVIGDAAVVDAAVYTGKATGMGEVTAKVIIADGHIVGVNLTGDNETPGIGSKAIEELPGKIVEAQSADVDGVAGATTTSNAIKEAVKAAMAEAGLENAAAVETTEPAADDVALTVALADAADGTYSATAQGFGGDITVDVTLSGGKIADVKIVGDSETPGLGAVAVEKMPAQLLEAQSADVDGVAGATVSTSAIRAAFGDALAKAGVDASTLVKQVAAQTAEKTQETRDVDVVIVGAGGAGMSAAITAKQQGKTVLLLEKMPYVGGNTTKATGGMNAAETHYQAEQGITDSVEQFVEDTMKGGHNINNPDLVRTLAEKSADAINWLDEIGAPLPKVSFSGGATNARIHAPADGSGVGSYLVNCFSETMEKLGIEVLLETKANEIIMVYGAAAGVKAESPDKELTINAKAVILTTGGFGANEEMYCTYRPDLRGTVTTNAPGATGDGIVMAQAVGADLVDIDQIQLHPTVEQATSMLITEGVRGDGAILVNQSGVRFVNELQTRDVVSAAELEQEGQYAYVIFDQNLREGLKATEKYIKNGIVTEGETIEALAEKLGIDPAVLAKTLADWNDAVAAGEDKEFGRTTGMEHDLSKAPYYAIKVAPGIHHTMGGVKINTNTQVIDTNGNVIPGLFAAGEVTGGVHGGNRIGGNAVADIVVYGRIAGANACLYADGQPLNEQTEATEAAAEEADVQVYTGKAQGMFCEIVAEVTVKDGKIADVKLTGADETPALGGKVLEEMPAKILDAQSTDVDGMTGATVTTDAVKAAVNNALAQAGLKDAA